MKAAQHTALYGLPEGCRMRVVASAPGALPQRLSLLSPAGNVVETHDATTPEEYERIRRCFVKRAQPGRWDGIAD